MRARPSRTVAALVSVLAAVAVAGCGGSAGAGTTDPAALAAASTLVIWADEKKAPVLPGIVEQFEAETGIDVVVQQFPGDELQANFVTASQAGQAPDLVLGAHDWIGNLVQNGVIDPVQLTDEQKAAFAPLAIRGETFNGQLYAVPFAVENVVLIRNTDLAPTAPQTIEELVATGEALVASGRAEQIMALPVGQNGDAYHAYPLFTSAGGYIFGTDAQGDYDPRQFGLLEPSAIAAMERIAPLGEAGDGALKRSIGSENVNALFTGGQTAFLLSGPWQLPQIRQAGMNYAISPIPGFAGAEPARPFVGVQGLFVASRGRNKLVAQEFATRWFTRPEVQVALYQVDPRPPALLTAFEQVSATDPDMQAVLDAGQDGDILPAIPQMAGVFDPFGKAVAAVVGGAPPGPTITSAGETIASQF